VLERFEKMMNERIREKEFKFKDRKYVEKLDKE